MRGLLIREAGQRQQTSYSTGYDYDQILPMVAIALGIASSLVIGGHFNHACEATSDAGGL